MLIKSKRQAVGIALDFLSANPPTHSQKQTYTLVAVTPPTAQNPRWLMVFKALPSQRVFNVVVHAETGQTTYGSGV